MLKWLDDYLEEAILIFLTSSYNDLYYGNTNNISLCFKIH